MSKPAILADFGGKESAEAAKEVDDGAVVRQRRKILRSTGEIGGK
jgi:hypothetical protein